MLKLLLNHWQAHREPAPFVLTEDPLYCTHLTTSGKLPQVYSVNRVNPIFEDEEETESKLSFDHHKSDNGTPYSDDTGYTSETQGKSVDCIEDALFDQTLSSDSDEPSKSVVISVDVHRESHPDDVIVLNEDTRPQHTRSLSSDSTTSQEPFDSLTATNQSSPTSDFTVEEFMIIDDSDQTDVKKPLPEPTMNRRQKLERLLQNGNTSSSSEDSPDIDKTKTDLMKSLTRAFHQKVPKADENSVTRSDSTSKTKKKDEETVIRDNNSVPSKSHSGSSNSVTRRDESSSSSSHTNSSKSKKRHPRHQHHHHHNKHKNVPPKPITLHQLLPGHWSYDNLYLPQMPGVCYQCMHHPHHGPHPMMHIPETDMLYHPQYYHQPQSRHSWAPKSGHGSSDDSSSKKASESENRSSPDGSSHESDNQHLLPERRSLRVPKKCKCDACLASTLGVPHFATVPHPCTCYFPHRKVKFASETDLSKSFPPDTKKLDPANLLTGPVFPINLHKLNGHVNGKSLESDGKSKGSKSAIPRGLKEPVKMGELNRFYPINFQEWEANYRRKFLHKRRKRALNMVGMAIGIILVIGVAVAITFVLLRLKRPI